MRMTTATYTAAEQAYIDQLHSCIAGRTVPMAVVDYLGKLTQRFGQGMQMSPVTEKDEPAERFGTRDLRHVAIYDLTVIKLNAIAEKN